MGDGWLAWALSAHSFGDVKIWILAASGLSRDALHIYFGLAIFVAARLLLRGPQSSLWALALVFAAALGGEALDHLYELSRPMRCDRSGHIQDLWNTGFWPLVLALLESIRPRRSRAGAKRIRRGR